jgi:hypothetical protein
MTPKALPGHEVKTADSGAEVTDLEQHRQQRKGGRPSGRGYDPASGKEILSTTYLDQVTRESTSETDVFTLVEARGYREDRFYTRSLNADGHGERMNVRLPQGLDSQIYAAVSAVPEYRSVQDFWRDSAVHRLEFLQKRYDIGESARRTLELERIKAELQRGDVEIDVMTEAVDDLELKLQRLWDRKDWAMMAEQLRIAEDLMEWLREPYRTRAVETVEKWKGMARDQLKRMRDALEDM